MTDFELPRNTAIITDDYQVVMIELIDNSFSNVGLIFKEIAKKYPYNKILYTFTDDKIPDQPKIIVILDKQEGMRCDSCKKIKSDVSVRECGYSREIHDIETMEQICDECEDQHLMDI